MFSGANDNQYVALMAREIHEGKQIKATLLAGAEEGDSESEDENAGSSSFDNLDPQDDSQTENTLGGAEGSEDAVEEFKAQHLPTAVEGGAQGPESAATRHNDLIVRDENENKTAVTGRSKLPPGARPKERVYKKPRGNVPTSKGTQKVPDWWYKYLEERESQCKDELKTIENLKTVAASELKKNDWWCTYSICYAARAKGTLSICFATRARGTQSICCAARARRTHSICCAARARGTHSICCAARARGTLSICCAARARGTHSICCVAGARGTHSIVCAARARGIAELEL